MAYIGIKPANAVVTSEQIADGVITTTDLANSAVTPAKLSTGGPNWDSSGNVGIGTTSPLCNLDVSSSGATVQRIRSTINTGANTLYQNSGTGTTASDGLYIGIDTTAGYLWNWESQSLIFGTSGAERMRITSGGDFLLGTTNSTVSGGVGYKYVADANNPYIGIVNTASTNGNNNYHLYSTGAGAFRFYVGLGGTVFATSTTISGISDVRLKENIKDLDDGLDAVMALKPRKFDWKEGKGKDVKGDRGFIAQEFAQVFPDMIDEWLDPAPEGEEPYKAVNANLIPILVKAIQELKAELDATKAEVALLKSQGI